jgi:hypothetical protein
MDAISFDERENSRLVTGENRHPFKWRTDLD